MQTFLWLAATGLVAASSCRLLVGGLRLRRHESLRRECHTARRRQLNSESQLAQRASELADNPLQPGVGWRVLEVAAVVEESADVKSFYLTDPYDRPLPDFLPASIMVRPAWAGTYQATRCYSLSMAPNARCWRIAAAANPDSPPPRTRKTRIPATGRMIRLAGLFAVNGPRAIPRSSTTRPAGSTAAGVGITPLCSILHHALAQTPTRSLSLYYQASDLQHWPLGREVHSQCQQPNVHVVTYFSRTTEAKLLAARQLPGEFRLGYIDVQAVIRETDTEAAHYYMCGPESWMEGLRQQLTNAGVPLEQIHWECLAGRHRRFKAPRPSLVCTACISRQAPSRHSGPIPSSRYGNWPKVKTCSSPVAAKRGLRHLPYECWLEDSATIARFTSSWLRMNAWPAWPAHV